MMLHHQSSMLCRSVLYLNYQVVAGAFIPSSRGGLYLLYLMIAALVAGQLVSDNQVGDRSIDQLRADYV